jgi:hypothetical protein
MIEHIPNYQHKKRRREEKNKKNSPRGKTPYVVIKVGKES